MENTKWFYRHGKEHEKAVFNVNLKTGSANYAYEAHCKRCGGAGGADAWKYTGWTCYECGGTGGRPIATAKVYTSEKLAKLNAAMAKKNAAKQAVRMAKINADKEAVESIRAAWKAANPALYAAIRSRALWESQDEEQRSNFFSSLLDTLCRYGQLSEKQQAAAEASIKRDEDRKAKTATSSYVGKLDERITITLTVKRMIDLGEGMYGHSYLMICEDENGNCVTYKGASPFAGEGAEVKVAATVKDHREYQGMQQTQIARARVINL